MDENQSHLNNGVAPMERLRTVSFHLDKPRLQRQPPAPLHLARGKRSSDIAAEDEAALRAVTMAAPFEPLPPHSPKYVEIAFTFNYNFHHRVNDNLSATAKPAQTPADKDLAEATRLLREGKLDDAVNEVELALKAAPNNMDVSTKAASVICDCADKEHDSTKAIAFLHRAIDIDPGEQRANTKLDALLKQTGVDPNSYEQRLAYAHRLRDAGQLTASAIELNRCLRMKPSDEVRKEIGAVYVKKNGEELAARFLAALQKNGTAEAHVGLGRAYEMMGNGSGALAEYKKALEISPNYDPAKDALAKLQKAPASW